MNDLKQEIVPRYAFKKTLVNDNGQESFKLTSLPAEGVHPTYREYCQNMIINEIKEDMMFVHDEGADERTFENCKEEKYELPDGQQVKMGGERIKFTESLFRDNESEFPGFKGIH